VREGLQGVWGGGAWKVVGVAGWEFVIEVAGLAFGVAPLLVMHASAALAVSTTIGHLLVAEPALPEHLRLEWPQGQNFYLPEGWTAQQA